MRKSRLMLAAILLLGVGFAAVSTILYMNGNVKIAPNNADFDVRFTKANLSGKLADGALDEGLDITSTAISEDGKTITYSTGTSRYGVLTKVGDKSILDFEVKNDSTMYDAEVSIECSATGSKSDLYQIKSEVATPIAAKTTERGKIEVTLVKISAEDFNGAFTCTLNATAKERTTKIEPYYAVGDPLTVTDRTTDYTTLKYLHGQAAGQQAKVFVKLDADRVQKSLCIIRNGSLECFKNNDYAKEESHLKNVFGEANCSYSDDVYGPFIVCNDSNFSCSVDSASSVSCSDSNASLYCGVYSDDRVSCS